MKKSKRAFSLLLIVFLSVGIIVLPHGSADEANAISGVGWNIKSGGTITVNKTWELKTPEDISEIEIEFSGVEYVLSEGHEYDEETDVTREYVVDGVTYTVEPINSYGYVQNYTVTMSRFKLTSEGGWTKTLTLPDLTDDIGEGSYTIYPMSFHEYIGEEEQDPIDYDTSDSRYKVDLEGPSDEESPEGTVFDDLTLNVVNTPNYINGGYSLLLAKQWPSDVTPEDVAIEVYQDGVLFGKVDLNSGSESLSGSDFAAYIEGIEGIDQDTLGIEDDAILWYKDSLSLPKDDGNGHEYTYTFKESGSSYRYEVNMQSAAIDGIDYMLAVVTNLERQSLINISVTKEWEGTEGTKAVVHLFAGGHEIDSAELTSGSWTHVFTGLPETDEDGNAIEYTVTEDAVSGYTTEITGSAQDGFIITNTEIETPSSEDDTVEPSEDPEEEDPQTPDKDASQTPDKDTSRTSDKDTPQTSDKDTPQTSDKDTPQTPDKDESQTPDKEDTPQTGDDSHAGGYALIMLGSLAAATVIIRKRIAR
jgi:hypothetical protein